MSLTFKEFLTETYINAFSANEKQPYADQVWEILKRSYKAISDDGPVAIPSKEYMISNVPLWKIGTHGDKVLAVIMYKDHGKGRKVSSVGTDGSPESKAMLRDMMKNEFTRSYGEYSGPLYEFLKKHFRDLIKQYTIPPHEAAKLLDTTVTPTKDGFYRRTLPNGKEIEDIMIGTPGIPIKSS